MKQGRTVFSFGVLVLVAVLFLPAPAFAAVTAGVVLVATGVVKAVGADGVARDMVRRSPVYAGDRLVTAPGARAQVKFTDGAIVGLKPDSELRIDEYAYEPAGLQTSIMALIKGGFRTVTGAIGKTNKADYRVSTPVATIGIRGTLYDADYQPGEGLDLAVWDGGISACNSGGCLDLGAGADFRFGFISSNGRREGRNEPGLDERESDEGAGESGDDSLEQMENGPDDEDRPLAIDEDVIVPPVDDTAHRAAYPYTGFATVASAQANPWGAARTLDLGYGRAVVDTAGSVGDWSVQSATAGGAYINPGALCGTASCSYFQVPQHATLGPAGSAEVVWGYWYGSDVSVGTVDGVPTDSVITNPGVFVLGTYASPAVIATLTGTTSFNLYTSPTVIDGLGYLATAPSASGSMAVDLSAGTASGALSFQSPTNATWNLAFAGDVSTQGMNLALLSNAASPAGGSYFLPANGQAGVSELAVQGAIDAKFVGVTAVDGIVGAFDVQTLDQSRAAQGTFIMETVRGGLTAQ